MALVICERRVASELKNAAPSDPVGGRRDG
jgi:hypothetical protein